MKHTSPIHLLESIFPCVVHVFPLHLASAIMARGELLSGDERERLGIRIARRSTSAVDRALGVTGFVHLYLSRTEPRPGSWAKVTKDAPLLTSKLTRLKPFPHGAITIPLAELQADSALISCWNIGRGRCADPERSIPAGMFLKGDTPEAHREHWERVCRSRPRDYGFLKGRPRPPVIVPTVTLAEAVAERMRMVQEHGKELLVPQALVLPPKTLFWLFSREDERSVRTAVPDEVRARWKIRCVDLPGYPTPSNPVLPEHRAVVSRPVDLNEPVDFD